MIWNKSKKMSDYSSTQMSTNKILISSYFIWLFQVNQSFKNKKWKNRQEENVELR